MSGVTKHPKNTLKHFWKASVNDYALAGGFSVDGNTFIVSDAAGGIFVFNAQSGDLIWSQKNAHKLGALSTAIHPLDNTFVTTGQDGRILFWNTTENKAQNSIDLGNKWIEHAAWSLDGTLLAVSYARKVSVYNESGDELWQSDDHPSTINQIAWSTQNELATASYSQVNFFDGLSGARKQTLKWKGSLISMILSPDSDIVACGSQDNSVHFWRRSTQRDSMMSGYPLKPASLSFDKTGCFLATGGDIDIMVWSFKGNGPEGTSPICLKGHSQPISSLAFARQGLNLASGARDGTVIVWALREDNQESHLSETRVSDCVSNLYWHPNNQVLAALDRQGGVTVWKVE